MRSIYRSLPYGDFAAETKFPWNAGSKKTGLRRKVWVKIGVADELEPMVQEPQTPPTTIASW
jgi:hypothetical protein